VEKYKYSIIYQKGEMLLMGKRTMISDVVNNQLNLIVQKCFLGNRILDRMMSILSIKFVMNKTSNLLHVLISHAMPLLADEISDYQDSRNVLTIYLDTPKDDSDYDTPLQLFETFFNFMEELEQSIDDGIRIAKENNDKMTKIFLEKFLLQINNYTAQAILLCDKAEMYGNNTMAWMSFDRHIEDFIIVKPLPQKNIDGENDDYIGG